MKQYVIDELQPKDIERIKNYLDEHLCDSGIDGLYWKPVEDELLTEIQAAHTQCRPFCIAVTLEAGQLSCELLIRTRNRMRCDCMGYATEKQRNWIIDTTDTMLAQLGLTV